MRTDVRFDANGTTLVGWLYLPDNNQDSFPLVIMAHGFSALKEMGLDEYAKVFTSAGLACLVYDHRNFGASGGEPRQEIDPWQQMHDYRHAISYARTISQVDPERIGIWGASYAGGHALIVAAVDRRVKCVVAQVPLISGYVTMTRTIADSKMADYRAQFYIERERQAQGEPPQYVPVTETGETFEWIIEAAKGTNWKNEVTLLSQDMFMEYEPRAFIGRISPTPLLMIVGDHDHRCLTDVQLTAFNAASEPKRLVLLDAGHYDPYKTKFEEASSAARDWFVEHLIDKSKNSVP